jgi:hypothetical protein
VKRKRIIVSLIAFVIIVGAIHITITAVSFLQHSQKDSPWQFAFLMPGIFYYMLLVILLFISCRGKWKGNKIYGLISTCILFTLLGIVVTSSPTQIKRYTYDLFAQGDCILSSTHPTQYKTAQLNGDKSFIKMMNAKGYQYLRDEQLGGFFYFSDKNGKKVEVVFDNVNYYLIWTIDNS